MSENEQDEFLWASYEMYRYSGYGNESAWRLASADLELVLEVMW